jgi:protein TonB
MSRTSRSASDPFRQQPLSLTSELWRPRRMLIVVSVVIHVVLGVVFYLMPEGSLIEQDDPRRIDIVFYKPEPRKPAPVPPPEQPTPEPVEIVEAEPPPVVRPKPRPKPEAPRVARKPDAKPEVKKEVFPIDPPPPAPVKRRRTPRTGGFVTAENRTAPATSQARREVSRTNFATSGAEPATSAGRSDNRVVAAGSFGTGDLALPPNGTTGPRGSVTRTAFNTDADVAPSSARSRGSVQQGGFGDEVAESPRPRRRSLPAEELDTPVEIVSKPKPEYTEAAREARIQGTVVLEVTFVASGQLRVLRVVGALGHGLDEAAIEAARKVRFNPARRNGRAVDHTATMRVVFKLA